MMSNQLSQAIALSSLFMLNSIATPGVDAQDEFVIVPTPKEMMEKKATLETIVRVTEGSKRPPNIVLLFADDLGYGDVGAYGSKTIPTPHIDALAESGVKFTDAYVTAGTCSPSRAGLMSGCYQQRFGFEFNTSSASITHQTSRGLEPSVVTMADVLQQAGYATGMFGKWHLGTRDYFHPQQRGFDEFYGFLAGAHSFLPVKKAQPIYSTIMRDNTPLREPDYLTDALARETVKFINANKHRPFFAYVPFNAVHTPLEATDKYLKRLPNEPHADQQAYNAMTSALDDAVGSIVDAIKANGLEDNTLVIFLNDNGGPIYTGVQSNGPLKLGKLFLFEGGIRVPMILHWPSKLGQGKTYRGSVSSLDVFPTVCAAAGIELPKILHLDGVDLFPYVSGEKKRSPHETLFWSNGPNKAVRKGDWKLVKSGSSTWLYNLKNDIGETVNLATKNSKKIKELEAELEHWQSQMKSPAWPSKPNRRVVDVDGQKYELNI